MQSHEVYAVRYGRHDRLASANFIGGDPHDGPMPLDYYVWAIVGAGKTYVVDTGFNPESAGKRGRQALRPPAEGLQALGISPAQVADVIVTHMHYDHAGNFDLFANATYHIQELEMAYCSGRCMCHPALRNSFEVDDVAAMVRRVFAGRVRFHDGDEEIAPGLSVHAIGGHTMGLQSVRVMTRRGWVVLASDATHFYAHMEQGRVFPTVYNVGDTLEGYGKLRKLSSSLAHIVPGHDPLVMQRYPAAKPGLEGIAARLDADPGDFTGYRTARRADR
jgi:glyoxylase-like metal-dependent hydrolase (beta-lactamase superfamily II)